MDNSSLAVVIVAILPILFMSCLVFMLIWSRDAWKARALDYQKLHDQTLWRSVNYRNALDESITRFKTIIAVQDQETSEAVRIERTVQEARKGTATIVDVERRIAGCGGKPSTYLEDAIARGVTGIGFL